VTRRGTARRARRPGIFRRFFRGRRALIGLGAVMLVASLIYCFVPREEPRRRRHDDSERLAAAERRLRSEPNVANVIYARERHSWNVELPAGSNVVRGFAAYLCTVLAEDAVVGPQTSVRTVDADKLVRSGFDFERATVEHVHCRRTRDRLPRAGL
jgi:hypothetical protein